jgi:hypothetical protein
MKRYTVRVVPTANVHEPFVLDSYRWRWVARWRMRHWLSGDYLRKHTQDIRIEDTRKTRDA